LIFVGLSGITTMHYVKGDDIVFIVIANVLCAHHRVQ